MNLAHLKTYLQTKAAITALVSSRIYPGALPQGPTYPAITMHNVGLDDAAMLGGAVGHAAARVQLDYWSPSKDTCDAVAAAVRTALHGYAGAAGSVTITSARLLDSRDVPEPVTAGRASPLRHVSADYHLEYYL